jgi:aspartate 4-decarboxylase
MSKRITSSVLAIFLSLNVLCAYAVADTIHSVKTTPESLTAYERSLETLGAFEISSTMVQQAKNNEKHYDVLNAGRGNPNWISTQGRHAFNRISEFGIAECQRTINKGDMAGSISSKDISKRFERAMNPADETDAFLLKAISYCHDTLGLDKDAVVMELTQAAVGNQYPDPSRCLPNTEKILNTYLESTLYNGVSLKNQTDVFPTEGGTAAICYVFNSLRHNHLLKKGDKIAIATPTFTPYLQIPNIKDYGLMEIKVETTGKDNWNISPSNISKLEDPSIKAFFLVNPANPSSHALSAATLLDIKKALAKNPDLLIITDDVYGTFVDNFQTLYSIAPTNTILVYSFSKLYGVTGWRIGLIAMNKHNIADTLLTKLPENELHELDKEYSIVTLTPRKLSFIDRICADSRSIGLYHTSGLSTPQQSFMALLALTHLVNDKNDTYITTTKDIVNKRYHNLMKAIGMPTDDNLGNAKYYTLIDVYKIAQNTYGNEFTTWLARNFEEIDFLYKLTYQEGVVLMYGPGFDAPAGTLRVSLANLPDEAYTEIGRRILELLNVYHDEFLHQK